jgi:hypothetical protein
MPCPRGCTRWPRHQPAEGRKGPRAVRGLVDDVDMLCQTLRVPADFKGRELSRDGCCSHDWLVGFLLPARSGNDAGSAGMGCCHSAFPAAPLINRRCGEGGTAKIPNPSTSPLLQLSHHRFPSAAASSSRLRHIEPLIPRIRRCHPSPSWPSRRAAPSTAAFIASIHRRVEPPLPPPPSSP